MKNILVPIAVILIAIVQVTWANNWSIGGIVPNILLVALVLITIRRGLKTGLGWAFGTGIFISIMSPQPFSGYLIAILITILCVGILNERIFGAENILLVLVQIIIATAVFSVSLALIAQLAAWWWGAYSNVPWPEELIHLGWQLLYHVGLVLLFYVVIAWVENLLINFSRHPRLKRSHF